MKRLYKVFISSTYEDLKVERQVVTKALLDTDFIPCGMELFPASNDDQWTVIQREIDECDYYVVIVAGKYGSLHSSGASYTEKEYDYAISKKRPCLGFLKDDLDNLLSKHTEEDSDRRERLMNFREKLKGKTVCFWSNPDYLALNVTASLGKAISQHPSEGWVRARFASKASTVLQLQNRVSELEKELETLAVKPPEGVEGLAGGDDEYRMAYTFRSYDEDRRPVDQQRTDTITWNELFKWVGRRLHAEGKLAGGDIKVALDELLKRKFPRKECFISRNDADEVTLQLNALQLIYPGRGHQWRLTPYGAKHLVQLAAIRKPDG